jgi:hypothetical protein
MIAFPALRLSRGAGNIESGNHVVPFI